MLIIDALNQFYLSMQGALAPKTVRFYQDRLKSLFTYFPGREIESLTSSDLNAWRFNLASKSELYQTGNHKNSLKKGYSPFTLHQYVRACRRLFRWLEEEKIIDQNPALRVRLPELPSRIIKGISDQTRDRLLKESGNNRRNYAILMILADTGCRIGGLVKLRLGDLDLENRYAIIREKGKGGAQKERMVFFLPETVQAIKAWLDERPEIKNIDALFIAYKNNSGYCWHPMTENGVRIMLKKLTKRAGINSRCNPHNFRHSAIKGMLARSMPLSAASQLAGHSSCKITGDIYGTYLWEDLRRMHDKSSWLLPRSM